MDWVTKTIEIFFLTVLKAGHPRSRFWLMWFPVRALFLAGREEELVQGH